MSRAKLYKNSRRAFMFGREFFWLFVKYGGKFKIAIKIRCMKMHLIFCHVEANRILFLKLSKFRYP